MNIAPLQEFIGRLESRGNYDAIVYLVPQHRYPPKPVTKMTVGEVLDWQDSIDRFQNSEAVGKYQILEDTLRGLYSQVGIPRTALFNRETQDRLAFALMQRRGLSDYLAGRITAEKFANALAHEWASLPLVSGPNKGKSVYAGDSAGNRALAKADEFLRVVRAVKETTPPEPPRKSIWSIIADLLARIFGRMK